MTRTRTAATRRASKPRRRRRAGLAAVVVVGALATGGVAGAATGHLPGPVREAARSILVTVGGARAGRTHAGAGAGTAHAADRTWRRRPRWASFLDDRLDRPRTGHHRIRVSRCPEPGRPLPSVPGRQRRRAGQEAGRDRVRGPGPRGRWPGQDPGLLPVPPAREAEAAGAPGRSRTRAGVRRPAGGHRRGQPGPGWSTRHAIAEPLTAPSAGRRGRLYAMQVIGAPSPRTRTRSRWVPHPPHVRSRRDADAGNRRSRLTLVAAVLGLMVAASLAGLASAAPNRRATTAPSSSTTPPSTTTPTTSPMSAVSSRSTSTATTKATWTPP